MTTILFSVRMEKMEIIFRTKTSLKRNKHEAKSKKVWGDLGLIGDVS